MKSEVCKEDLTSIIASSVVPNWRWNSCLIWTMSTSQRDTITRISVSSAVPAPCHQHHHPRVNGHLSDEPLLVRAPSLARAPPLSFSLVMKNIFYRISGMGFFQVRCPCSHSTNSVKALKKSSKYLTYMRKIMHCPHPFFIHQWTPKEDALLPLSRLSNISSHLSDPSTCILLSTLPW